ncbi:hypothetical protein SNE40_003260 [Patella caerulea]|uniref:Major facilitator superfamily (MFS) profile domain-containing protein n=1 Tax=Patella caerulea TaxID=87958 RepID=A0AAN8QEZ5_PATCE
MGVDKRQNGHQGDKAAASDSTKDGSGSKEGDPVPDDGNTRGKRFQAKSFSRMRHVVVAVACIGMVLINAMRTNVGFTVLTILDEEAHRKVGTIEAIMSLPNVDWNSKMVGFLHSSFYIGYLLTHMPAGYLATYLPSYRIFAGSILLSCALNLLLPSCINADEYYLTCLVRFLQGLVEGSLYPGCYGVLRYWSTPSERGRAGSTVLTGAYAGAVVGFPVAGMITHYIGWQYVFYLNGCVGILWALIWIVFAREKPSDHPFISENELKYMTKEQGYDVIDNKETKIPMKEILTCPAVLCLCLCHFARNWVFILMLTNEPYYLSLFNFTVAENGLYASIPHVMKVLTAASSGYIADYLLLDNLLSITHIRKLLTGVGFGMGCIGFFILTFVDDGSIVLIFLTVAVGFTGFAVSGWQINHYDLSARYASLLVAITSTVGNIGSITVPLVTGYITFYHTLNSWSIVFYITSSVLGAAVITFLIFGSGQQQPWSNPPDKVQLVQQLDPMEAPPYKAERLQDSIKPTS